MTFPTRPHKNILKVSVWSLLRPGGLNMTEELFPEAAAVTRQRGKPTAMVQQWDQWG